MIKNFSLKTKFNSFLSSNIFNVGACLVLSWIYAVFSQICINIHIGLVPISLQTFILFLSVFIFGRRSLYAYVFYLIQGAFGAPFFSNGGSGFFHLAGPTGGYLAGFFFAMLFLHSMQNFRKENVCISVLKMIFASMIFYVFGLIQLACFVGMSKVLFFGFYPFLIGDLLKISCVAFLINLKKIKRFF